MSVAAIKSNDSFIYRCGQDFASEIIRNYFDTSDYNLTVDQLAKRILQFDYKNEYDPLKFNTNGNYINSLVRNYKEITSSELDGIAREIQNSQEKLFKKEEIYDTKGKKRNKYIDNTLMAKGKKEFKKLQNEKNNGSLKDSFTGQINSEDNRLEVDHAQAAATITYDRRFISEEGAEKLKKFYNSKYNFQMMYKSANASKGDVRVYKNENNKIMSADEIKRTKERMRTNKMEVLVSSGINPEIAKKQAAAEADREFNKKYDITYKASPSELTEAICKRWESSNEKTRQSLIEKGYLNKDGHVNKDVKKTLKTNIKNSQNTESLLKLFGKDNNGKNITNYNAVAKEAQNRTKAAMGKIIAGQIIYYVVPPLIFELRNIASNNLSNFENGLDKLKASSNRIIEYVYSNISNIFPNIAQNSLKHFIKSFFDIIIESIKATVKKVAKIIKNIVLSCFDAVSIITDSEKTPSQKTEAVAKLFGVAISSSIVEILFEIAGECLHIPEPFDDILFGPLQILVTVIFTNATLLLIENIKLFIIQCGSFGIQSTIDQYREEYEFLKEYRKELESLDIDTFTSLLGIYNTELDRLKNINSEEILNEYLLDLFDKLNIIKPWTGDFNEFMNDKNKYLVFS